MLSNVMQKLKKTSHAVNLDSNAKTFYLALFSSLLFSLSRSIFVYDFKKKFTYLYKKKKKKTIVEATKRDHNDTPYTFFRLKTYIAVMSIAIPT